MAQYTCFSEFFREKSITKCYAANGKNLQDPYPMKITLYSTSSYSKKKSLKTVNHLMQLTKLRCRIEKKDYFSIKM